MVTLPNPCAEQHCDEVDALRAENERLTATLARVEAERQGIARTLLESRERRLLTEANNERLRAALEKIANSGNVHPTWLVDDAREALGWKKFYAE